MGAILIVLFLLAVPVAVAAGGFVASVALGQVFSHGDDGDPPRELMHSHD